MGRHVSGRGFIIAAPDCKEIVEHLTGNDVSSRKQGKRLWFPVGYRKRPKCIYRKRANKLFHNIQSEELVDIGPQYDAMISRLRENPDKGEPMISDRLFE